MHSTLSHPTYRRWAIFYATAAALLAGWLLLEKMPDGREELAGSVEGAFRRSGEAMRWSNRDMLNVIRDAAADYPALRHEQYKNRAERAMIRTEAFEDQDGETGVEERLSMLKDSLLMLADGDTIYQRAAEGIRETNLTNEHFENCKNLIATQLLVQAQALTALTLDYCAQKITGDCRFDLYLPIYETSIVTPTVGEPHQAKIFLSVFGARTGCVTTTAFLNDQPLPLRDGIATIRTTFPTPGPHTLRLRFRREMCRDGSVTEVSRDFQVNVLAKCAEE